MKIGIFTASYLPEETLLSKSAKHLHDVLKAHGEEVIIITNGLKGQKKVTLEEDVLRIPYGRNPIFRFSVVHYLNSGSFLTLMKKLRFDLFQINQEIGMTGFAQALARKLNVPVIRKADTLYEYYYLLSEKGKKHPNETAEKQVKKVIRTLTKHQGEIICTNEMAKELIHSINPDKHVEVIPVMGEIAADNMNPTPERLEEFRKEYHLENKKAITLVARPGDDFPALIRLYQKQVQKEDQVKLFVLYQAEDEKRIKEINDPSIASLCEENRDDLACLTRIDKAVVILSERDVALFDCVQAMARKKIVIARYSLYLKDIIEEGNSGFFFENMDTLETTLRQVSAMSEDEKNRIGENALKRVTSLFNEEVLYQRLKNVYEKAIRQSI